MLVLALALLNFNLTPLNMVHISSLQHSEPEIVFCCTVPLLDGHSFVHTITSLRIK